MLCAASAGSVASLDMLVKKGGNLFHTDKEKRSALVIASGLGHSRVVEYLVEVCKVPVNELDNQGWTPLMHAAALGRDQVVEFLLRNGAEATVKSQQGKPPTAWPSCAERKRCCIFWSRPVLRSKPYESRLAGGGAGRLRFHVYGGAPPSRLDDCLRRAPKRRPRAFQPRLVCR